VGKLDQWQRGFKQVLGDNPGIELGITSDILGDALQIVESLRRSDQSAIHFDNRARASSGVTPRPLRMAC
jgi:hypothetical protein